MVYVNLAGAGNRKVHTNKIPNLATGSSPGAARSDVGDFQPTPALISSTHTASARRSPLRLILSLKLPVPSVIVPTVCLVLIIIELAGLSGVEVVLTMCLIGVGLLRVIHRYGVIIQTLTTFSLKILISSILIPMVLIPLSLGLRVIRRSTLSTKPSHTRGSSYRAPVTRLRHVLSIVVVATRRVLVVGITPCLPLIVTGRSRRVIAIASGFLVVVVVETGSRVVMTGSSHGSGGRNIPIQSLSPPSLEHEEHECQDTSRDGETDNNEDTSDSTGVVHERGVQILTTRAGVVGSGRVVDDLGDGVDLSTGVRLGHGLRDKGRSGGDDMTGGVGCGD
jgi:hypothetical protein